MNLNFDAHILPIALTIVSLLGGAWLSTMWPVWQANRRYSREIKILGEWHSAWSDPKKPNGWVAERINVAVKRGQVALTNQSNSGGYTWIGTGAFHDRRYLYGTWASTKPGSHSSGVFCLYFLPQGDCAVGHSYGPDHEGRIMRYHWALGQTPQKLANAKRWLSQSSPVFLQPVQPLNN